MTEEEADYLDYRKNLGFVITKKAEKPCYYGVVFLVNRDIIKNKWWSVRLSDALSFTSEEGANKIASTFKYGNIEVKGRVEFHK